MTPEQIRIQELEKQVAELTTNQRLLLTLFRDSSFTRLALHNVIAIDKEALLGCFGATPTKQASAIADVAAGGTTDTNARTTINAVLAMLRTYGIIKT